MRAPALCIAISITLAGCEMERRVVRYNPPLGRVPGAHAGMAVTGPKGELIDPSGPGFEPVVEHEDGSVTLHARTGRHLMSHIARVLLDSDEKLFVDQVLSDVTRREYIERGLDPGEAFRTLQQHVNDVRALFRAMPLGEHTPGVIQQSMGGKSRRLILDGPMVQGMRWVGMDMVQEKGEWRLRWFVPGSLPPE